MLLTLIRTRKTRYGYHAELIEKNHSAGDKPLASLHIPFSEMPLPLCYPVSVPKSGIALRGRHYRWKWKNAGEKHAVEEYLREQIYMREEIILDIC